MRHAFKLLCTFPLPPPTQGRLPSRVNVDVKGDLMALEDTKVTTTLAGWLGGHDCCTRHGSRLGRTQLCSAHSPLTLLLPGRCAPAGRVTGEAPGAGAPALHGQRGRAPHPAQLGARAPRVCQGVPPAAPGLTQSAAALLCAWRASRLLRLGSRVRVRPPPPPPQVFPHEYRRALAESDAIKAAEAAQKEVLEKSGAPASGGGAPWLRCRQGCMRSARLHTHSTPTPVPARSLPRHGRRGRV